MNILKRIKIDFNTILLKATSLVAIGAFLVNTTLWGQVDVQKRQSMVNGRWSMERQSMVYGQWSIERQKLLTIDYRLSTIDPGDRYSIDYRLSTNLRPRAMDERHTEHLSPDEIIKKICATPTTAERLKMAMEWYGVGKSISVLSFATKIGRRRDTISAILSGKTKAFVKTDTIAGIAAGVGLPEAIFYPEGGTPSPDLLLNHELLENHIGVILDALKVGPFPPISFITKELKRRWPQDYAREGLGGTALRAAVGEALANPVLSAKFYEDGGKQPTEIYKKAAICLEKIRRCQYVDKRGHFVELKPKLATFAIAYAIHYCIRAIIIASKEPNKKMVHELLEETHLVFNGLKKELAKKFLDIEEIAKKRTLAEDILIEVISLIRRDSIAELDGDLNLLTGEDYNDIHEELHFYRNMLSDLIDASLHPSRRDSPIFLGELFRMEISLVRIIGGFLDELQMYAGVREWQAQRQTYRQTLSSILRPRAAGERELNIIQIHRYVYGDDEYTLQLHRKDSFLYEVEVFKTGEAIRTGVLTIILDGKTIEIYYIKTDEEEQGKGIASEMMKMTGGYFISANEARGDIANMDTLLALYCAIPAVSIADKQIMREAVNIVKNTTVTVVNFERYANLELHTVNALRRSIAEAASNNATVNEALLSILPDTLFGRLLRAAGFSENMRLKFSKSGSDYYVVTIIANRSERRSSSSATTHEGETIPRSREIERRTLQELLSSILRPQAVEERKNVTF